MSSTQVTFTSATELAAALRRAEAAHAEHEKRCHWTGYSLFSVRRNTASIQLRRTCGRDGPQSHQSGAMRFWNGASLSNVKAIGMSKCGPSTLQQKSRGNRPRHENR
jgi:hypothetical protein